MTVRDRPRSCRLNRGIPDLTRDCCAAYLEAEVNLRRLFNRAFFSKIYIDEGPETREQTVRVDYNQPFDDLLSRVVPAHVHHRLQAEEKNSRPENRTGVIATDSRSAQGKGCPPSTLVELRGFEPLTFSMRTRRATNCATAPVRPAARWRG